MLNWVSWSNVEHKSFFRKNDTLTLFCLYLIRYWFLRFPPRRGGAQWDGMQFLRKLRIWWSLESVYMGLINTHWWEIMNMYGKIWKIIYNHILCRVMWYCRGGMFSCASVSLIGFYHKRQSYWILPRAVVLLDSTTGGCASGQQRPKQLRNTKL